jgi:hypothetical protein
MMATQRMPGHPLGGEPVNNDTDWHNMAIQRLKCVLSLMVVVC